LFLGIFSVYFQGLLLKTVQQFQVIEQVIPEHLTGFTDPRKSWNCGWSFEQWLIKINSRTDRFKQSLKSFFGVGI